MMKNVPDKFKKLTIVIPPPGVGCSGSICPGIGPLRGGGGGGVSNFKPMKISNGTLKASVWKLIGHNP
jgi:hypothetical protein